MKRVFLYLAGASREAERARSTAAMLAKLSPGPVIVDRWFDDSDEWSGRDHLHTRAAQVAYSAGHERAIRDASIFWLLWPQQPSYGALCELGYATAHHWHMSPARAGWHPSLASRAVVVSGPGCADTIYTGSADFRDPSDELAMIEVVRLAELFGRTVRGAP